ncbi:MAG: hypothetical protein DRR42_05600 [Gammaproteobacteria bacterium]|nr:MAG: hypothetical protein DRR42_05600 [Gammaproteobacteria bacterium]
MNIEILMAALATWASIAIAAALIGLTSGAVLFDRFGNYASHVLEVSMMVVMIYSLSYVFVSTHQLLNVRLLLGIGTAWVVLTLGLELLIGHYALGEPWARLRRFYRIEEGQLYSIALLVLLASPYVASLHAAATQH